jgi:ankyrin repeat protein
MAMDILLQNDANPHGIIFTRDNAKDQEWGQAAFWECATKGRIKLLEFMMNCGLKLNAHIEVPENRHEKFTLLHRATYCGQAEVVRLNFNRSADINFGDANKNTALHKAAEKGSLGIMKILLDNGISVNLTNTNNSTPLHFSAEFSHLEAPKFLVERGAAINKTNKYGYTPLMLAAYCGKLEIFCYLTEICADINIGNANNTALHIAAESGSVNIMKLLLDKGISVNLTNKNDSTPLHFSVQFSHLEAPKFSVERGAAINET